MGKVKKLKAERKIQREIESQKRAKKRSMITKGSSILIVLGLVVFGANFGYQKYGKKLINNKVLRRAQDKEEKVTSYKTGERTYSKAPEMIIDTNKEYIASIKTNKGDVKAKLFTKEAPKTVNNFVVLSRDKFYDGLVFHRIIKDFMIQGGDPNGDGTGGPGYKFEDEKNDKKLVRGVLAMANSGPNTNGSQFFIVTKEATEWLDGKHTPFGEITEGLEKVMEIEKAEVGENDRPKEEIKILSVTIEEK